MGDAEPLKGSSIMDKDGQKRKRPGRDKESRMKDLSDDESSGEVSSDSSALAEAARKDLSMFERIEEIKVRQDEVMMQLAATIKEVPASIKVSIERKKYEKSYMVGSTGESSTSRDDPYQIEPQMSMNKYRTSSCDAEKEIIELSDNSYSSDDISSGAAESKRESRKKNKILKNAKMKRMKNMREEPLKSIKVSIERKKYEKPNKVDETQKCSSGLVYGEGSSRKKNPKEDKYRELEVEFTKILNVPDKIKERKNKSDKRRDQPQSHEILPERSTSLSESVDVDSDNQEQSKEISSNSDEPNNQFIEEDCEGLFDETSLDIKKDSPKCEKEFRREKSPSKSSSSCDDSSPNQSNINKASFKKEKKDDLHFIANRKDNERERKFSGSSESSDSSSENSAPETKYTHRSRDQKRGRVMKKTMKKDNSRIKRISSKDNRGKSSRKGPGSGRKYNRRESSESSTSSSSSKSFSDSSSSTSGSSSSGSSSSMSNSASKDRSSSSSSSASSSSGRRRHKRSFKTKENTKHQSRCPLNIRRKSDQPPRPKKIHVGHLSKNINKFHLHEIFGLYGKVKNIDLPLDRTDGQTPRGFAYIEYSRASDAEKALRHMNGGIIDGQTIAIAPVLVYKPRPVPPRRMSPNRRPFMNWRYTPPFRNRGGGAGMNFGGRDRRRRMRSPPRRRSPRRRTRSRSPNRRPRVRHRSASSTR